MFVAFGILLPFILWKPVDGCGQPTIAHGRVVGGEDAVPGSWPWQVAIYYDGSFHCGGSLISPEWLVTAAHCSRSNLKAFSIVLGEHDRKKNEGTEQHFRAKSVIPHPDYNGRSLDNDIAVIRLDKPAKLNDRVKLICVPDQDEMVPIGSKCYITGWGKTSMRSPPAAVLQQSHLPIVDSDTCKRLNRNPFTPITTNMVCAGYGPSSPRGGCQGDSGGPLVCNTGNRWVLQGAVSWGSPWCSTKKAYTVFARVSRYRSWLRQFVRDL